MMGVPPATGGSLASGEARSLPSPSSSSFSSSFASSASASEPAAASSAASASGQQGAAASQTTGGQSSLSASVASSLPDKDHVCQLLLDLCVLEKREAALADLSKRREQYPDLAPLLWHSFGTIAAILQEIIAIYPCLSPPTLTAAASNRVCNSLALLQCVASHPDTRQAFLNAHIPLFLYPFLNTVSKTRPLEYLRLTSLGVVGALVKIDDAEVINFLLQTEIIPLCLRIMETGSELSKTVATFIVQKVLLDDVGLSYICATAERFYAVSTVLCNMVSSLAECPPARLLKHVIRCYLRLTDNDRAREALKQCLPDALKDATFHAALQDEPLTKKWLLQLLQAVAPSEVHNAAAVQS
ncbi:putative cell differentiation protein RCD1 [Toxoplasma gondii CAST]|uniref:Putative cell differentiation protein RCD1 n=4 Tax=Toxoplasma gondii TaxID=5811 RepID=A0A3R7YQX9_TOXGO|nr:putative cell differentiation protein RCD1 [Toxoplasma gondii CAST]